MLRTSGSGPLSVCLLGYGWIIERNGLEIARGFGLFLGNRRTGSNIAEYLALIDGLETLGDLRLRHEKVEIRGDAKCVIDQMMGYAGVSSLLSKELNKQARRLAKRFTNLSWVWVPRWENRHADSLSRRSFRYLADSPHLEGEIKRSRFSAPSGGHLVPLVDLTVHAPFVKAEDYLAPR